MFQVRRSSEWYGGIVSGGSRVVAMEEWGQPTSKQEETRVLVHIGYIGTPERRQG